MSHLVPVVYDGSLQRPQLPGDILANYEPVPPATDTTNTTLAVTAAMMLNPVYVRQPAGVSTDTYATAAALIAAISSGIGRPDVPRGLSFRWRVINLSANLITGAVTANTGATMTRGNILASSTKDFQVNITNGTPAKTVAGLSTTNGSAVVSAFADSDLVQLSPGMVLTNSVANLQGQTILSINLAAKTVTMSGNANADTTLQSLSFSPTYTITGLSA